MPRRRKTAAEASRDNARRFNERQPQAAPLFVQAGLTADLIGCGVIRLRNEDHQLRVQEDHHARMRALEDRCWRKALAYSREARRLNVSAYRDALLHLRRLRLRYVSMRGAVRMADHWHTHLRQTLPLAEFLTVLDRDENAALNIRREALVAAGISDTLNARGDCVKPASVGSGLRSENHATSVVCAI